MTTTTARGWTADWLNGWLAAIGATVVAPELRLSWSHGPRPTAVLSGVDDLARHLYNSLPSIETLHDLATARELTDEPELPRNFDAEVFASRAAHARANNDWSLGPCASDLVLPDREGGDLDHGPFDVPMPRGITLHERVVTCRETITNEEQVRASLQGVPELVQTNGLGFDSRRLEEGITAKGQILVDPVVEVLAFHALGLFPVTVERGRARSRLWRGPSTRPGAFRWGTWTEPLDCWGVDARLDLGWTGPTWETVPYRPSGSSDVTRAYASRRVHDH